MSRLAANIGVAVFGILSFGLTVAVVATVGSATGFNIFTFSFWLVLPVGALLTGVAAASGYYFGSLLFHVRPTRVLLVQMVILAALSMLAIYYAEYLTVKEGSRAGIGFWQYVHNHLTNSSLNIDFIISVSTGRIGLFGYVFAAIEFVGFLAGGYFTFLFLRNAHACPKCNLYYRKVASKRQGFSAEADFLTYYNTLFRSPVDTPEFARLLDSNSLPFFGNPAKGTISIRSALRECPRCKDQLITQHVQIKRDRGWESVQKLNRAVRIPQGVDLRSLFGKAG